MTLSINCILLRFVVRNNLLSCLCKKVAKNTPQLHRLSDLNFNFFTEIFELAMLWLEQSENFLKIESRSGGSDGDFLGALFNIQKIKIRFVVIVIKFL